MKEVLPVIKGVLANPYVIGTAIVVILYMNFCSFVANYKKKPPKPKKAKAQPAAKPAEKKEGEEGGASGEASSEEKK